MSSDKHLQICEMMRKVSTKNMLKLAAETEDPADRFLLHEELSRAFPNAAVIASLLLSDPTRASKVNASGSNSIHIIAQYIKTIDPAIVLTLIDAHPDGCSTVNKYGLLPIHKAAINSEDLSKSSFRSFKMILATYPDGIRIPNIHGQLAIHLALSSKHPTMLVINYMIEAYPESLRHQDKYGHLPIHQACANKNVSLEIIIALISSYRKGCSYGDINGFTPLHWIASHDNPNVEIIKELLNVFPMAVHIHDIKDRKPIDLQKMRKSPCAITEFLLLDKQEKILSGKYDERVYEPHEMFSENSRPPTRDESKRDL